LPAGNAAASAPPPAGYCNWVFTKSYNPTETIIGATYDITDNVTQDFIYGTGQDSSLGVGESVSGNYGTFTASGTASFSTSSETDYGATTGPRSDHYLTNFVHSLYTEYCSGIVYDHQTRPTEWAGGATTNSTGAPTATYCLWHKTGS